MRREASLASEASLDREAISLKIGQCEAEGLTSEPSLAFSPFGRRPGRRRRP